VFIDYLNKLHKLKPVESKYLFSKLDKKPMQYMNIFTYNKRLLEKLYINPKKGTYFINLFPKNFFYPWA
jgi:hypothetical protein